MSINETYLHSAKREFESYKGLADRSIVQLTDNELHYQPDAESNSIAIIMQHLAGNMISRWTDFLTTDGEKPDRDRDGEFEDKNITRTELLEYWDKGWAVVFDTLNELKPEDMERTVHIRSEPHSVVQAINRQLTHYAYHVGQIVYMAKHLKGADWKQLTIPKNKSREFNQEKFSKN